MRKGLIEVLPLIMMGIFITEMTLFVLIVLKLPIILLAYTPLYFCFILLLIKQIRKKEGE